MEGSEADDRPAPVDVRMRDRFGRELPFGSVVGTESAGGDRRGGIDIDDVFAVDRHALRVRPPVHAGWSRAVLAYGPFHRRAGRAFTIDMLNGHHSSENTDPWPGLGRWGVQWLRGSQVEPAPKRLRKRLGHDGRDDVRRRLSTWKTNRDLTETGRTTDENLAIGWFGSEIPGRRTGSGHGLVVRALGPDNGELTLDTGSGLVPLLRGIQNVPFRLVTVLRDRGAIHYIGSLDGAAGMAALPALRPLVVDTRERADQLWCGIHQSVLGQVGWGVDSRVHSASVVDDTSLADWDTTAIVSDRLLGDGPIDPPGGDGDDYPGWVDLTGAFSRSTTGLRSRGTGLARIEPSDTPGLIHLVLSGSAPRPRVCLGWRCLNAHTGWFLQTDADATRVEQRCGSDITVHHNGPGLVTEGVDTSIQILDDGVHMQVVIGDHAIFEAPLHAPETLGDSRGVAFQSSPTIPNAGIRDLEIHPRLVHLDAEISRGEFPLPGPATELVVSDDFDDIRPDLAGRGDDRVVWTRTMGELPFTLDGSAAVATAPDPTGPSSILDKVKGLVVPTGHRTAYTIPWQSPIVELETSIVPPGGGRGEGHKGRGGFVFAQDDDNFLIVSTWLDDEYEGASMSSFFHLGGYEELYDAVWTNVGARIEWGTRYVLRVGFDGMLYVAWVNDEPVLYRRLTDVYPDQGALQIRRVGLITNWEFGDDTGTRFEWFRARA